jgi:hypothetical protein
MPTFAVYTIDQATPRICSPTVDRQQGVLGENTDEGGEKGKWAEVDDL